VKKIENIDIGFKKLYRSFLILIAKTHLFYYFFIESHVIIIQNHFATAV